MQIGFGQISPSASSIRDLGTRLDLGILTINGLSWNSHSDMITAKANRMLGLIERTYMDLKDESEVRSACSVDKLKLVFFLILMR